MMCFTLVGCSRCFAQFRKSCDETVWKCGVCGYVNGWLILNLRYP